jgi:hypothetical protein
MILSGVYTGTANLITINTSVSLEAYGSVYFYCSNHSIGLTVNAR